MTSHIAALDFEDFTLHIVEGYISNLFFVVYKKKNKILLFDSGSRSDVQVISHFCKEVLNRDPEEITLSITSHMHPDHAGGAVFLRKKYGIPNAAHRNADRWYNGISGIIQHKLDEFMAQVVRKRNKLPLRRVSHPRRLHSDFVLKEGDPLPFFPDWEVIEIPGHTLHDIGLYHKKERLIYPADCIVNVKGKWNLPIPVFFHDTMKGTFEKLASLETRYIIPAHGDFIETDNPHEIFDAMIDLIDMPKNDMSRRAHRISAFAPAIWKSYLKKLVSKNKIWR